MICPSVDIQGPGSHRSWSENGTCPWTQWACNEVRTRSKWEPCYPKMHWVHTYRKNLLYYLLIPRPSSHTVYSSLWLSRNPGKLNYVVPWEIVSLFYISTDSISFHMNFPKRVLEHCSENSQSQCIVHEILESAYALAQDQYGNYVTQVCIFFSG